MGMEQRLIKMENRIENELFECVKKRLHQSKIELNIANKILANNANYKENIKPSDYGIALEKKGNYIEHNQAGFIDIIDDVKMKI